MQFFIPLLNYFCPFKSHQTDGLRWVLSGLCKECTVWPLLHSGQCTVWYRLTPAFRRVPAAWDLDGQLVRVGGAGRGQHLLRLPQPQGSHPPHVSSLQLEHPAQRILRLLSQERQNVVFIEWHRKYWLQGEFNQWSEKRSWPLAPYINLYYSPVDLW
jgi:hypothetical protein